MSKQKTSTNARSAKFIKGCLLFVFFFYGFYGESNGQDKPDLTKPFKRCRVYGAGNGLARIVASDNDSNIILTNDEFKLISIDPVTKREIWVTDTGGRLEANAISDGDNLFFLTSFENEKKVKTFILNSISLRAGTTVWQKKLSEYSDVRLYSSYDKERIFIIAGTKLLFSVSKLDGEIAWRKEFPGLIISLESLSEDYLNILTEDRLYRVVTKSGGIYDERKLGGKPFNKTILRDKYIFIGYLTGEIAKVITNGNKNEVLWRIKTGGGISGLFGLDDRILAASLDNFLYLFSTENGNVIWKRRVSGRINMEPLIYGNFAVVLNSADNLATVVNLSDGKVVNQVTVEDDNYFSGPPSVFGNQLILQTFKGIYFFVNSSLNCP